MSKLEEEYQIVDASGAVPIAQTVPEVTRVKVIAPSDLQAGYRLHVHVNGVPRTVIVPAGGVKQGQEFEAVVENVVSESTENPHNIPSYSWRDGLCDCCSQGCCHAMLCLSWFFTPIALGQVMTRMKLDACGRSDPYAKTSAFKVLLWSCVIVMVFNECISAVVYPYRAPSYIEDNNGNPMRNPDYFIGGTPGYIKALEIMGYMVEVGYAIYILLVFMRTRSHIRSKYQIPSSCCGEADSVLVGICCQCCGVAQMGRHTADYETYGASCCTETGLNPTVPPSIV